MPNPYKFPDVYGDYGDTEGFCELAVELGLDWGISGRLVFFPPMTISVPRKDIHHIWSMGRRPDFKSNLIALADYPHDRFHFGWKGEQEPIRMLCMLAKARKSDRLDDPTEFDVNELNIASGKLVRGWTECLKFEPKWEWCEKFRAELLERIPE